jgi:uncharacterized membrane protein YedE/YeeE
MNSTLFIGFLIGCAFGAILFLGGATSYRRILGTLLLKDMWIIKLMMTAIGVGTLGIYLLDMGGLANMSIKPAYIWGVVAGGAIFGVGWAVAGYCPGTCVVGSAEGKKDAIFTLLGALAGALVFSLVFPTLEAKLCWSRQTLAPSPLSPCSASTAYTSHCPSASRCCLSPSSSSRTATTDRAGRHLTMATFLFNPRSPG